MIEKNDRPKGTEGLTREEFKELAVIRAREAGVLYEAKEYVGATYLVGYAVECALKACIANLFNKPKIPDKGFVEKLYVHKLGDLLDISGLKSELQKDELMTANWKVLADNWSEFLRYYHSYLTPELAGQIKDAVLNPDNGVLQWLERMC